MILWYIRKTRNQKVWENVETTSSIVVSLALQSYSEWLSADASNNIYISASPPSTSQQIWTPPAIGLPKCNFDAIIFKDQNVFGIGMCLRDDNGTFIKAKTKHYQGTPQPQEAEVYALHQALVWIQQFKMMKDNLAATKPRASLSTIQKSL
ncbi:hypothetical protein HKD37_03G007122 [Glycine soja]|nr:hypothetical protein GYH30_006573 [Glycine max]KAH1257094.1 hypothetical protein GmHk_03G007125 [Glycine max]